MWGAAPDKLSRRVRGNAFPPSRLMGFQGERLVVKGFWNGSGMGDRR